VRAAIGRLLKWAEVEMVARFAWALWLFWGMVGDLTENRRSMDETLAGSTPSSIARARLLHTAGALAWAQGDCPAAERLEDESAALFRDAGDDLGAGMALGTRGMVANQLQQHEQTVACCKQAADCFRKAGLRWGVGTVMSFEAAGWLGLGDRARAKQLAAEALALCRETGERYGASICALHILAGLAQADGEREEAKRLYAEGLTLSASIGEKPSIVHCLQGLAELAGSEGRARRAARLWGAAEGLLDQLAAQGFPSSADPSRDESRISAARVALGDGGFLLAAAEGKRLSPEAAVAEALSS
jgi:tetratricopeptide (TPR) repeat protein